MRFALLGKTLGYSYSKDIHQKFGYDYDLLEVEEKDFSKVLKNGSYDGFNVTVPYKKEVVKHLDFIDDNARTIGSVNTVVVRNRKLFGYNTDFLGLEYLISSEGVVINGKSVLILGTGGTCSTAKAVCEKLGAKKIVVVGRTSTVNYQNCYENLDVEVLINTTPVGTYPNTQESLIDVNRFLYLESVIDVVYNPLKTQLILNAEQRGIKAVCGLKMLVAQAVFSAQLFTNKTYPKNIIEEIYKQVKIDRSAIVFIGMPSSGKTTVGRELAKRMGREFFDIDEVVTSLSGKTPEQIILSDGEEFFREVEAKVLKIITSQNRTAVISVGGGAILKEENRESLKRNSIIIHVERDLEKLSLSGRPLSKSVDNLKILEEQRMPIYCDLADFSVDNNQSIEETLRQVEEKLV